MISNEENEGGFVSHLTELKKKINSFFYFFIYLFYWICYIFSEHLYGFLVEPFAKAVNDEWN